MTRAVQHVGVPGHEWQAGVLWDGALVFGPLKYARSNPAMVKELALLGNNALHVSVGYGNPVKFVDRTGAPNPDLLRSIEAGYLPIPSIETKDGNLIWNQMVFAHLLDRSSEQGIHPGKKTCLLCTHASASGTRLRKTLKATYGFIWGTQARCSTDIKAAKAMNSAKASRTRSRGVRIGRK